MVDPRQQHPATADSSDIPRKVSDASGRFEKRTATRANTTATTEKEVAPQIRTDQKYYELFELAPDAYFVTDTRGVIREANAAASQASSRAARRTVLGEAAQHGARR